MSGSGLSEMFWLYVIGLMICAVSVYIDSTPLAITGFSFIYSLNKKV